MGATSAGEAREPSSKGMLCRLPGEGGGGATDIAQKMCFLFPSSHVLTFQDQSLPYRKHTVDVTNTNALILCVSVCGGGEDSGLPRNFVRGGGVQQIQLRTENGDLGAVAPYPLVKGSGGSCNFVQEISFHIVKVC